MKHCCSFLVIILLSFPVLCQMAAPASTIPGKPVIDSAAIANWADLLWSEPVISNDGKYFMYPINNLPPRSSTLVVQQTEGTWKKEFIGAEGGFFSGDSKQAIFKARDTLYLLQLGKDQLFMVTDVVSCKRPLLVPGKWLAYQLKKSKELVLLNLYSGKERHFSDISEYQFDEKGRVLLVKSKTPNDSTNSDQITWFDLADNKSFNVWPAKYSDKVFLASLFQFDQEAHQLTFLAEEKQEKHISNSIWYYKKGMDSAVLKVSNENAGIDSGMVICKNAPYFSQDGKYIFFKIQPKPKPKPLFPTDPDAVKVDIWSYTDMVQQYTQQLNLQKGGSAFMPKNKFTCIIPISGGSVNRLEQTDENIQCGFKGEHGYMVVTYQKYRGDKSWLRPPVTSYLVSLTNGSRSVLSTDYCQFSFHPDEDFLVYYNYDKRNYFCYNLSTGETLNISETIPTRMTDEDIDERTKKNMSPVGIAGWLKNKKILLYDNYDIWKVDLLAKERPVNITNGYGQLHHVRFKTIGKNDQLYSDKNPIILTAFNVQTKDNGFFSINLRRIKDPKQLAFGPYNFYTKGSQAPGLLNMKPVKAKDKNAWIVKRQTACDAPNYFITKNLKTFTQLTNVQPQLNYNWFKTELLTWKQPNGFTGQGVLYKPENFDEKRRYPVIVNYYEKRSQNLHQFLQPEYMSGDLNIPWFVSRGYLVFTPDIHYVIGKTGESVVNSVVSGVKELYKLSFVDSSKVAIQGHSFGGYETNYLATHSDIFAAAAEAAGPSDWISNYGSLMPYEQSTVTSHFEQSGQNRVEATLWENPQAYIENSPIFNVHKVTAPLLIMHNQKDDSVPWGQAIELFIALRRLDKKVWMLQYDNGAHGVHGKDAVDYTLRLTQFFDHYLKGALPPKWMTLGIPAKLKGIETGLQLDASGSCGDCPVCKKHMKTLNTANP